VLVLYFAVSYPLTILGRYLERRLGLPRHKRP
jgi:ABC-type amino acid transport system permease subunit